MAVANTHDARDPRDFLSVQEVIERLGVCRSLVFRLIGNGEIRSVLIGRRRMIPVEAYSEYVARLKAEAA